jgi:hypothetical protein
MLPLFACSYVDKNCNLRIIQMNSTILREVTLCSLVEVSDGSEERTASVFWCRIVSQSSRQQSQIPPNCTI